jgi:hypothetical protein
MDWSERLVSRVELALLYMPDKVLRSLLAAAHSVVRMFVLGRGGS